MKFVVLSIALALAPGLKTSAVQTRDLPAIETRPLPLPEIEIETRPLPLPDIEIETRPLPLPEPEVETRPLPLPQPIPEIESEENPCATCFAYMSSLIEDLVVLIPETEDAPEVETETRPLPLPIEPEVDVRPLPLPEEQPEVEPDVGVPETPDFEIRPLPLPESDNGVTLTEAEAEEELARQNVPLPEYIIRR